MSRDMRDPKKLGEVLLRSRRKYPDVSMTVFADSWAARDVPEYDGSGPMSNDPSAHHSKVKQDFTSEEEFTYDG